MSSKGSRSEPPSSSSPTPASPSPSSSSLLAPVGSPMAVLARRAPKWFIRQVGIRLAPPPEEVRYGDAGQVAEADRRGADRVGAVGPLPDRGGPAGGAGQDHPGSSGRGAAVPGRRPGRGRASGRLRVVAPVQRRRPQG